MPECLVDIRPDRNAFSIAELIKWGLIAAAVEDTALRPCQHRIANRVPDRLVDLDQPANLPSTLARERAVT